MTEADAVIAALRAEHDLLAAATSGLGEDGLAHPSGASAWDVSEVLSHLGSGAEINQGILAAALGGPPRPDREAMEAIWARWNAMDRGERAAGFLRESAALTERYEALGAEERVELRVDMGFLPEPVDVATAARLRLRELTLHSWDVRVAFDSGAVLGAAATAQLLNGAPDLTSRIGKPDALDGRRAVVAVTTADPRATFALHLDDPVRVELEAPATSDGELALPAESWLRLVSGRLGPAHTPARVTSSGAADLDLLRRVFPGY